MTQTVIDQIRQRYVAWRARGRSRDGFFRLVCRGFDDVLGACGGKCLEPEKGRSDDLLFLDSDFSLRWFRDSVPDFARLNQTVSTLGVFGPKSPLVGTEEDEVWYYALALIAEKTLAWLAMTQPKRAELFLALGRVKDHLHKKEEAEELYREARRKREAEGMRMRRGPKTSAAI